MIPAGNPWQKAGQLIATPAQRLEMCRLATSGNLNIEVLDIEINRSGPTYSIETVLELEKTFPGFEFSLVLGTDTLKNIKSWHRFKEFRGGPTYSIDTVLELENTFPGFEFSLVLGTDTLKNIKSWHRVNELIKKVEVLQLLRINETVKVADLPTGINVKVVEGAMLDLSSTMIREKVAKNADVSELVDSKILNLVKGIYGA